MKSLILVYRKHLYPLCQIKPLDHEFIYIFIGDFEHDTPTFFENLTFYTNDNINYNILCFHLFKYVKSFKENLIGVLS